MKILLVHQFFLEVNDGGGSRFNEITRFWSSKGHEITVLSGMFHYAKGNKDSEYKGKKFVYKRHGDVKVWRCFVSDRYNSNFPGRLWGYFSFVFSSIWAGIIKVKGKYDLILVTSPPLFVAITAIVLSKLKRIPFVFEVRDLWPESAIDTGVVTNKTFIKLAYWLESVVYKKAKLINVLTPAFKDILITRKGVSPEKIILIPNGADFSLSDEILEGFNTADFRGKLGITNSFVVTYVGAHGVANHLIQLVEAAELLRDTNVMFLLIGSGMEKDMLITEVQTRGLLNVKFFDQVSKKDIFKYILASDLGVSVLKKTETFKTVFSNKTFDYMSCKKPVLLAIDGVSRELIENADCGLFAEPENHRDIANKIRFYMSKPELMITHGLNGYRYAKEHFSREVLAEEYLEKLKVIVQQQ